MKLKAYSLQLVFGTACLTGKEILLTKGCFLTGPNPTQEYFTGRS